MYADRKALYEQIEAFSESRVICFVTGDRQNMEVQIASDAIEHFVEHLDKMGRTKKISLIIHSRGGITTSGWSIANLIRHFCDEFQVIIPSKALSTATLIALGADALLMTKQATLGPIDPSVNGPLNPQLPGPNPMMRIPVSVESINGYLELAKTMGIKNEDAMTKIVLDLATHVHPVVLGDVYRTRSQIRMLGKRLLSHHTKDEERINKILDFLCSESGSHDYTIDRREAKDELGLNVAKPNDGQYKVIKELHDNYSKELELLTPFDPNTFLGIEQERDYDLVRGLIETVAGGSTRFVSKGKLRRTQVQIVMGAPIQTGVEDRRTFEGWTND